MIEIHLFGKLRKYSDQTSPLHESVVYLEAVGGESIKDVVNRLGIPPSELSDCIFLNGEYSSLARMVQEDDRLGLFPDNMLLLYRQHFSRVEE